jgi:hypothetical protein
MRTLLALALLLPQAKPPADEVDKARDALAKALTALDRFGVDRACATLVKANDDRCVDIFVGVFRAGLLQVAELEKEKAKVQKELDKHEVVRDKDGKVTKGDPNKWALLKNELDLWQGKIDLLHGALPRIVSNIGKLTTLTPIVVALNNSAEWYVRACCAEALGRIEKPEAVAALIARAQREIEPGVRVAIADALSPRVGENEEARKALLPWLEGGSWASKMAAAQALAKTRDKRLIPAFIRMLQGASTRMKHEIDLCLGNLTGGVTRRGDFSAWEAWWDKNENEVLAGTYVPTPADKDEGPGITTFYGIPLHSTKVVFIIDVSLSMKDPSTWKPEITDNVDKLEGERGIDVARYELRKIVRKLPEGALFNVIGMYGRLSLLSEKWVSAVGKERERAVKFINAFEVKVGTDVHGALMRALDFSGGNWNTPPREDSIDTIFLLSDGMPSVGSVARTEVADRILDAARFKRIAITTIAITGPKEGRELLKKIADGTGGLYVLR